MLAFILFLTALFGADTTAANPLVGSWVNQDSSTGGITEIAIGDSEDGRLRVHVWPNCEPRDCDWGITDVSSGNGLARSTFDFGFLTTAMEFVLLPDGRLLVAFKTEYRDQSQRHEPDHAEFFVRKDQRGEDAESIAAKALLKKVAEAYRTISAGRFEFEEFEESVGQESASRRMTLSKVTFLKSGKFRVEKTGSNEPSVTVSDGKTVLTFFPESNEYNSMPWGKQFVAPYIATYALLDGIRKPARIVGSRRVADAECTMVAIGRDDNHTRTLWIDPKTNFVRKEEVKDISTMGGESTSKSSITTFSAMHAIEGPESTIFSFDPAKTLAKERRELQKAAPVTSIGTKAPEFVLRNLEGKEVRLSELRGKTVLLDFWATWCLPCRNAMPGTELLHRQLKDKNLIVLGIDDEDPEQQSAFLRKFGYSFSSLVDPASRVKNLYNVGGIPATVLIDGEGKIRAYELDASYETMWKAVHELGDSRESSRE